MQGNIASRDREGQPVWYFHYDNNWKDQLSMITDSENNVVKEFTYDNAGNMLTDGTNSYTWNGNRLVSSTTDDEYGYVTSYTYNSSGLRTSKTVTDWTYEYFYNGDQLAAQKITYYGTYVVYMNYVYGESGLEWILYKRVLANGTVDCEKLFAVGHNPQGMIDMLHEFNYTSNYGFQRTYFITYTAFGELWDIEIRNEVGNADASDGTVINDLLTVRYKDYLYDSETGLYYLQQRYYDPTICRFISPDTLIAEGQGTSNYNLYAYCGNNPIMYADPTGEMASITMAFCMFVAWVSVTDAVKSMLLFTSSVVDLTEELSRPSSGHGYYMNLFGNEVALGDRFGRVVYFAADCIGEEMIAGTIAFLELMDFCNEFHVDVDQKTAIGIFYFLVQQAEVDAPISKKLKLVFGADAIFSYASSWLEVIRRDYIDNVDAEYMTESHMAREMFGMIRLGNYGG
ncbi:MAG: RHS repeat-associated core domain-containing protein [Clostridia bacterium]|nr:RHS repeat-associated core domain-containing protein [Clostridia bacterium]